MPSGPCASAMALAAMPQQRFAAKNRSAAKAGVSFSLTGLGESAPRRQAATSRGSAGEMASMKLRRAGSERPSMAAVIRSPSEPLCG